jgi:hypothetical protein
MYTHVCGYVLVTDLCVSLFLSLSLSLFLSLSLLLSLFLSLSLSLSLSLYIYMIRRTLPAVHRPIWNARCAGVSLCVSMCLYVPLHQV